MLLLFIAGLCVGSFLNLLADRLPQGEDVISSRSHCEYCRHKLRWYELIPLLSFIMQKGKSRCCHKKLSLQYPVSELATGIGFVIIYNFQSFLLRPGFGGQVAFSHQLFLPLFLIHYSLFVILFSSLLVIVIADLKYEIIPVEMIVVGCIAAVCQLFLSRYFPISQSPHLPTTLLTHLASSLGAGLFFFALWFFSKGKAMGDGDIYLAALIGLLLGFPKIIISLYASFLTGAVVGIILVLGRKKTLKAHIPFGPFLILGWGIALLWGDLFLRMWRLVW